MILLQGVHVTYNWTCLAGPLPSFCLALLFLIMDEGPPCLLDLPVGMRGVAVQVEVSYNASFLDHLIYLSTYNAKVPGHSSNQLLMFQ